MVQPADRAIAAPALPLPRRMAGQVGFPVLTSLGWPALWLAFGLLLIFPTGAFLILAFSPRLFDQGPQWLTLANFAFAFQGAAVHGLLDSLLVGCSTAFLALCCALILALVLQRTTVAGKGFWSICIWALLLMPSYLYVLGWESLVQQNGVLQQLGITVPLLQHLILGPVGVIWILAMKGMPFGFLAISVALAGLGREFEDAARVHGASRGAALRVVIPILAPALWSAIAIVFAESISDFGVASTLAATAHFPLATYTLYQAIDNMPIEFPVASAVGWFLIAGAGGALFVQYRALKGRSYAVLSGRTRPASPRRLTRQGQLGLLAGLLLFFLIALGVPVLGAVSASLLQGFGSTFTADQLTLGNYQRALNSQDLRAPLLLSFKLAALGATCAIVLGTIVGRLLARRRVGWSGRALDLLLLGAIALPGIVLAAGYIFAYNLPLFSTLGVSLYGSVFLLGMAYLAGALPSTTRLLAGPLAQVQRSMTDAARVHGAGEVHATMTIVVPLLGRALLWAWLLTFSAILLELPVSQLLYPPGQEPLAVAVVKHLANYDFGGGSAMMITALLGMLAMIALASGFFRLLTPRGWQRGRTR